MPHHVPLRAGDPRRVGRYRLTGRLAGLPSDDPLFIGAGPDAIAVAISLLGGDWARDGAARDRFAAEAAVAKRVPPFCAARVLDAGLEGDTAFLVSEYIPGQSLFELVASDGVRESRELEALAIGMATGLASVHQAGLVHGSFGPQYLILPPEGTPRVVEFGITPPYGSATPSADMFAWAQTVVFAATGHPPAAGSDLTFLPERTREPVQQCLELQSTERPAARAVLQFLLGDGYPSAGLLAEGSRRAARLAVAPRPAAPAAARLPAERGQPRAVTDRARQPSPGDSAAGLRPGPGRRPDDGEAAGYRNAVGAVVPGQPDRPQGGAADGQKPARRRAAVWALGAAALVVIALVVLLIVHLAQGGRSANHGNLSADTGHSAATSSASPGTKSLSPTQAPTMPAAFGGIWSGPVTQGPATFTASVTLTAGQSSGSIAYSGADFNCSGDLSVTSASATTVTMEQGIVVGQKTCNNGTVTVSLSGAGSLSFNFQSPGSPPGTGTLTRQ
jgi:serine/threonine protein kinase